MSVIYVAGGPLWYPPNPAPTQSANPQLILVNPDLSQSVLRDPIEYDRFSPQHMEICFESYCGLRI